MRFVADFIGETNFVEGKLVASSGQSAEVELPGGRRVTASMPADFAPSGTVTVMLRPEHTALTAPEAPEAVLAGTLGEIVYFGTDTFFDVHLDDKSTVFKVRAQNKPSQTFDLARGNRVGIRFEPGAPRVLRN